MSSVRAIAKRLNVSIATVSRALNNHPEINPETSAKVLKAANEIGYFSPVGRRITTNIGFVSSSDADFYEYDALLLAGIRRGLSQHKFDVTIISLERDKTESESYTQFFLRKGVRGVIVQTLARNRHIAPAIAAEGFPVVVVADRFEDNPNISYISYHSGEGSRRAVEHLIHLGHKRVALAMHVERDSDHADRYEAYKQALLGNGIDPDPDLVVPVIADINGGISAMNRLMSLPNPPTAIYFTDPLTTVGAMRRAYAMGLRIPDDISIIGFDDSDMRFRVYPPLTAVCQNATNLGMEAGLWLTQKLLGMNDEPMRKVATTFFEVNQTTGLPPRKRVRILPDGTRIELEDGGNGGNGNNAVLNGGVVRNGGAVNGVAGSNLAVT
jgi:DNA-binding LacI/PurR family transcriptional regulator